VMGHVSLRIPATAAPSSREATGATAGDRRRHVVLRRTKRFGVLQRYAGFVPRLAQTSPNMTPIYVWGCLCDR
jgi:hypothetical protein